MHRGALVLCSVLAVGCGTGGGGGGGGFGAPLSDVPAVSDAADGVMERDVPATSDAGDTA